MVAEHAWPVRLQDGVLLVGVDEPAWVTHLGFLGPDLVRRLGLETGDQTVTKVVLKVVSKRPKWGSS
jgi:predicted nucleic acid-binding Zn ribbon protein